MVFFRTVSSRVLMERPDLAPHYQDARTSVIEELRYRTNRSSDNRFSRRHCFKDHIGHSFVRTQQNHNVKSLEPILHITHSADKGNQRIEFKLTRQFFQGASLWSISQETYLGLRTSVADTSH